MANHSVDITGKVIGYLRAVRALGRSTKYGVLWEIHCRCGTRLTMEAAVFTKKPRRNTGIPKSCGCDQKQNRSHLYKGVGDLSSTRWLNIKRSAAAKGLPFEVTIEYAWALPLKHGWCCALSGVDLKMSPRDMLKENTTASLDRIDSTKGYVAGNVQWVHKVVNDLKSNMPEAEFILWCQLIANCKTSLREAG